MQGMDRISGMKGIAYAVEMENSKAGGKNENGLVIARTDTLAVSEEYTDDRAESVTGTDWKEFFNGLKKQFSGITFYTGDSFLDCVSADKDGISAVISHRFMEKLLSGGEEAREYQGKLVQALERLQELSKGKTGTGIFIDTEKAVCWEFAKNKEDMREPYNKLNRVSDMIKEFELANTQNRERWKKNQKNFQTGNVSNLYSMAAMMRDKAGVFSVVAKANQQISSLKMAAAGTKGAEAAKINATVNSLRKLVSKCNSKMRKIEKAEQAETEYKRALKKKSRKKAEECKKEMNRRRRILRSENEGIKNAGLLEDWKNSSNFRLMDEMDRLQTAYHAATSQESPMPGSSIGDAGSVSADAGITVTETIQF